MTYPDFNLISHKLCPYVQRAAIALQEQDIRFQRTDIDLDNKPEWFLKLSPLGKVPLLVVDREVDGETVLFESSVIAEYVNEVGGGKLLAEDLLEKSSQRAWIEFASSVIANLGKLYSASDEKSYTIAQEAMAKKLQTLEENVSAGEWFGGKDFSLVDAAIAPAFRYFEVIEPLTGIDFFDGLPKLSRWRQNLAARPSVQSAVGTNYHELLIEFLAKRDSIIGNLARPAIDAAA